MQIIARDFRKNARPYVIQSVLATLAILLILLFLDVFTHTALIATLGSSVFLVFTRPHAFGSRPRSLLGGYGIGIVVGVVFYYLSHLPEMAQIPISQATTYIVFSALSVGCAIFLMVITSAEHPPAAGMALGLVINTWTIKALIVIMLAVVFMAVLRRALQNFMIDLVE
ncbi:MAG: HPP family protein [Gammaproteobacteria bacterium]|nr:HPP family protein [Gammaproteobacteria bacterium]